jgi:hypothetical protein
MGIGARKVGGLEKVSAEVEGEIHELVSRDVVEPWGQLASDGEMAANNLGSLVQRVSLNSIQEINGLVSDFKMLRERMHHYGERMACEIVDYASFG